MRRGVTATPLLGAVLFLGLLGPRAARAGDVRLGAFLDTIRFDLRSGKLLVSGREGIGQDPSPYELRIDPLRLRAVKDEVVAFQLGVTGAEGEHRIGAPAFVTASGAPSPVRVEIFDARGIEVDLASRSDFIHSLGPGRYPDPLVPTTTVAVPLGGGLAVLWVDLYVPRGTATGTHHGVITVGDAEVKIELEVLDLELPAKDVARIGAVNFGSFLERHKRDPRFELAWMQMSHAHHLSVEVMRPTPAIRDDGSIDWDGWAARVGPYVDGSAFTEASGYVGPRAGLPTARWIIPCTDWWPSKAAGDGLPADRARFSEALKAWERTVVARGWLALPEATSWILFINSLDEPAKAEKLEALKAYEALIAAAGLEDRGRVLFRVDGNFGQGVPGWDDARMAAELGGVVDLWNVHGAPWTIPWPLLEERRRADGERVMYYASNTSGEPAIPPLVLDSPLAGARAWGWIIMRYGLEGALNWEVDYGPGCAAEPLCSLGHDMNLDATLIFRGEEVGARWQQPIASMRLKALRRGAQDAALLHLLAARDVGTARDLLTLVVPRALGDGVPSKGHGAWPSNPGDYNRARDAILDRLAGEPKPLPLRAVRQDEGPEWLRETPVWPTVIGLVLAAAALGARAVWKRRRR